MIHSTVILILSVAHAQDETSTTEPELLSAYLGAIDVALPGPLAAASGCPQIAGDDGMPVVFSVQVDAATIDPEDFTITTESGMTTTPSCATLQPAIDEDELFTVLLTGPLGTDDDRPFSVQVTGEIFGLDGEELQTLSVEPVTNPEEGTSLVFAFLDDAGETCQARGSTQEIAATFQGGITAPFGNEVGPLQLPGFNILEEDGTSATPRGYDDLNDGDNHLVLCVPPRVDPVALSVDAGTVFDPGNFPNPETSVSLQVR